MQGPRTGSRRSIRPTALPGRAPRRPSARARRPGGGGWVASPVGALVRQCRVVALPDRRCPRRAGLHGGDGRRSRRVPATAGVGAYGLEEGVGSGDPPPRLGQGRSGATSLRSAPLKAVRPNVSRSSPARRLRRPRRRRQSLCTGEAGVSDGRAASGRGAPLRGLALLRACESPWRRIDLLLLRCCSRD